MNIQNAIRYLVFLFCIRSYSQIKYLDWQNVFGLSHNIDNDSIWYKPVKFYFNNPNCSPTAKEFYYGKFRPIDDVKTEDLLNLVISKDEKLRPFYRWILNQTILIQDGALGELTGIPARRYAENFPQEFFEYMDSAKSTEKYSEWVFAISYSGFYKADDFDHHLKIRNDVITKMNKNCKDCDITTSKRIIKFAKDCFPND